MKRLWLAGLLACVAFAAHAHALSVAYVDIARGDDGLRAELDVSVRDLALTVPLDADGDDVVTWDEVQAAAPALQALALRGLAFRSASGACALRFDAVALRRYDEGAYVALPMTVACPGGGAATLDYALFFDRDARHCALVTDRAGDAVASHVVDAAHRRVALDPAQAGSFAAFVREGVHHILSGYDHLAFLLSLLLPAALRWQGDAWRAGGGLRATLGGTLGVVTAFTLAHSLTLSLAALGWVAPASRWIELAIAASVLVAALNNLRPVVTTRLWMFAFGFGLVHGFGFAGALSELGLPTQARLASLVGFNLGVELGQLAIVALALPLLFAVRHRTFYARGLMPAMSLGIAAVAGVWCIQRLAPVG